MFKNAYKLVITIFLSLLLLLVFQITVFAAESINTKVIITGKWTNIENRETTVVLTKVDTGKVYKRNIRIRKRTNI